jgi:subtilase family serine protease
MKLTTFAQGRLVSGLLLLLTIPVMAEPMRVFGPPEPGHVRPPLWVTGEARVSPRSTTSPGTAPYTPAQVQSAYGFNLLSATGAGQTIALVDAYDDSEYIQNDLNTFCSEFGIASTTVNIIYAQGSKPVANSGWQEEESLDVEWSHAIAPGAKILLVEAASSSLTDLLQAAQVAVNNGADVVSMSWGSGEFSGETGDDSTFTAPGVTYVASAGDSGAGVEWPAASPNVLGVGGTTLMLNSTGGWSSETAWSDSGGGISAYETPQPTWQNDWFQSAWTPVHRGVPDVAYIANPNYGVYVVYAGSWYEFGGTSVGAPQWSALIALANQGRTNALSGVNEAIYSAANGGSTTSYGGYTINATYFHDITSGDDGSAQDNSAYVGYDLVTGVGSPLANNLVAGLSGSSVTPPTPNFALTVSPSSQSVAPGGDTSYTVTVSPSGGYDGTVDLSVSGLPSGAAESFTPASITQSGSATLAITTGTATPTGTYTLTIMGADSTGSPTHSATATLVVANVATTMTVSAISYSASGRRDSDLNITLAIVNNLGSPVADASVSITLDFNGSAYASGTAATGSNGEVTFTLENARAGTYSTVVTSVKASGLTWNGQYPANSVNDPY